MDKHPYADIEWYDGGMTMEDQQEYRKLKQSVRRSCVLHTTAQQQRSWKEQKIAELTQKVAANEEYIAELEEKLQTFDKSSLEAKYESLFNKYQQLQNKYSQDINAFLHSDEFLEKYRNKIQELEMKVHQLQRVRDELIYKLNQHANI